MEDAEALFLLPGFLVVAHVFFFSFYAKYATHSLIAVHSFTLFQVEAELKSCSFVDNMCVYGDSFQNHVIGLVIPNPNAVKLLAQRLGRGEVEDGEVKALYDDPIITSEVLAAITAHAKKAGLHKSEIPLRIKLCKEEWTPDNALLTAGLKIRRKQIRDFYARDIDELYQQPATTPVLDMNGNIKSSVKSPTKLG